MVDHLAQSFKQVIRAQCILLLACGLLAGWFFSLNHGWSVVFGGCLAVANAFLSRRSMQRASEQAYITPETSMLPIFAGLFQRLLVFASGLSGGVLLLGLLPLPVLIGFGVSQLGYLACAARS